MFQLSFTLFLNSLNKESKTSLSCLHSVSPDAVSGSEDPLVRDESAAAGVSPLALPVVLQGHLKHKVNDN